MSKRNILWIFALLLSALSSQAQNNSAVAELPLPCVPQSMTAPRERAAYIIAHFWDAMNFADTLRSHNTLFIERNMVNFISLFPHTDSTAVAAGLDTLMAHASVDRTAFRIVNGIAEKYLAEPNSPERNEDWYILFLEAELRTPKLTDTDRLRPTARLRTASKNRPGMKAADFKYTNRKGTASTLHKTGGELLLLIFYDPACTHCTDILHSLRTDATICRLLKQKRLCVLAIYTEGDRPLWEKTKADMPTEWTVGIDESGIVANAIYDVPAMPVLYLLDRNKRIILKDPTPQALTNYLSAYGHDDTISHKKQK